MAETQIAENRPKTKKKGPSIGLSIVVFVIGTALASFGGFTAFSGAFESLTVDAFDIPGAEQRTLEPGQYDVFGEAGSSFDFDTPPSFDLDDITVTQVDSGTEIEVTSSAVQLTTGRGLNNFVRVGLFEVTEPGDYRIEIDSETDSLGIVARGFLTSFGDILVPIILLIVGAILVLLGAIMFVVGIIRRSRADKAAKTIPHAAPQNPAAPQYGAAPQNPAAPLSPTPPPFGQASPPAAPQQPPSQQVRDQPAPPPPPVDGNSGGEPNTPW